MQSTYSNLEKLWEKYFPEIKLNPSTQRILGFYVESPKIMNYGFDFEDIVSYYYDSELDKIIKKNRNISDEFYSIEIITNIYPKNHKMNVYILSESNDLDFSFNKREHPVYSERSYWGI